MFTRHSGYSLRVLLLIFAFGTTSREGNSVVAQTPSGDQKSAEEILKGFVAECEIISPGTEGFPKVFRMGGLGEGPFSMAPREITLPTSFRICKYEVTQELYEAVMKVNPSRWKGPRNSVEMVSLLDAEQFCQRLTGLLQEKKLIRGNEIVRLPTEAEWEYCCRAGTTTRFSFGDSATAESDQGNQASVLSQYAWHTGNAAGNDPPVGALKPNPWGLYDMHGYLWEFVSDPYEQNNGGASAEAGQDDSARGTARIIRGGSWRDHYALLSSAWRLTLPPHAASDAIGFRCVIAEQNEAE